jgi:hypothetical protein
MSFFYYFRRKTPLLRAFLVFCLASAFASDRGVAATIGADGQISASNAATDAGTKKSKFCSGYGRGMTLVDWTKEYGEVCRPTGDTLSARVNACLARGLEAVMVPDFDGVVCAGVARGTEFLKAAAKREGAARYAPIEDAKIEQLCQIGATTADRRLIPRTFIKDLVRKSKDDIDPHGVRIIGGAFCDGIDVAGLEMPYSLVLDKSVFACSGSTECRRAAIEIRNFKTKGDFSIDNTFSYISVRVVRSEISGSLYGHSARFPRLLVSDSIIHGSLKAPGANIS